MSALELHEITKTFGDKRVLKNISLTVEPGEIHGILGAAGSGKSAALRIAAGLDAADGGSAKFDGADLNGVSPADRGLGFITQEASLFPEQNVFANVSFGLKERGLPQEEIVSKTNETLMHTGLEELGRAKPDELSAADRLMAGLARALATDPKFLVIDAPFTGLDIGSKENAMERFRHTIKGLGLPVLYAAQDYQEAFALCDRVGLLHDGEIVQTGSPRELYEHPQTVFAAQITGRNNFITARRVSFNNAEIHEFQTANGDHRVRTDKMDQKTLGPINQDVTLAIRPENISLSFGASFPEDNLLKAVVKDVRYQGATTRITLDAAGLMLEALVLRLVGLNIFDECLVGLPPDRILVLKD